MMDHHPQRSPRLYNDDIAPRTETGNWRAKDLFAWWMSAWHSLGGYTMAVGLLVLGLASWETAIAMAVGIVVVFGFSNLMGIAGQRVGVPFAVFARISFGVFGANIPALLRAVVAVAWYGIQTYLASAAAMLLLIKIAPGTKHLDHSHFLGLSTLGWICFLVLWAAQLAVLWRGMDAVRKLSEFSGITIWFAMLALAVWVLNKAHWHIDWSFAEAHGLSGIDSVKAFLGVVFLVCAYMAGPMLNFADFTRLAPDARSVRRGNQLGLLLNGVAFLIVALVIALASDKAYGAPVTDPVQLLTHLDTVAILLVAIIAISIATVGINIILNFVSPALDFANAYPERVSFRIGGAVTAVLALVCLPWKLYASPTAVNDFLGGVGATMGPLLGIMLVDYYLVRRGRVDVDDLYSDAPTGAYFYRHGFNPRAVIALVVSVGAALAATFVGAVSDLHNFAWPIGVSLGGVLFLALHLRLDPVLASPARSRALRDEPAGTASLGAGVQAFSARDHP